MMEVSRLAPLPKPAGKPVRARRAQETSLLDGITIDYGPPNLLSRLFLKAEAQARHAGVRLAFAPFERLLEVNRAQKANWRPLLPLFQPELGGIGPDNGFCILGYNANGEVVATQAARLYTWTNTSFKEEAESLRLFYKDPERSKREGENCRVTAKSAEDMVGRVAFSGAVWYRPDYRKHGLTSCITRISKALAFTRWHADVTLSIMAEEVVKQGTAKRVGYSQVEFEVMLTNSPVGTVRTALIWMRPPEMLEHLEHYLRRSDPEIDRIIHDGAA